MSKDHVTLEDYGEFETAWCPGCGNFSILKAVKSALVASSLRPQDVLFVSGIGQAAKAPHYLRANVFNGLHGRALPVATGAKLANPRLTVIVESGDGCVYAEGGNHFLAAVRRNVDLTLIVHDNQIYGLTKGQASPTSEQGFVTKAQPQGVVSTPFNPVTVAVAMRAGFVARGYAGDPEQLQRLIQQAIAHRGFALVDVLQPCVSFNRVNTFSWYRERCRPLPPDHDPSDWLKAMEVSSQWPNPIFTGVIYLDERRPPFEDHFPALRGEPLGMRALDSSALEEILGEFI